MKISILNGNSNAENKRFDSYIEQLTALLNERGQEARTLLLRDMKLNYCIGCYTCWLKTPGICIFKDDGEKVLSEYINSDFVIFASPVVMGFISALLKGMQERMLPLMHPYLYVEKDRSQHVPRYEKYPDCGLLLSEDGNFGEAGTEIIDKVFKSSKTRRLVFTKTIETNPEEIVDEICNI